jgi:tellurite resistance-related uncharacterized protein
MSLDAETTKLTRYGKVEIEGGQVTVYGFRGQNATCRDVAVLACAHAIGVLQREMMRCIETPGGGKVAIGG